MGRNVEEAYHICCNLMAACEIQVRRDFYVYSFLTMRKGLVILVCLKKLHATIKLYQPYLFS